MKHWAVIGATAVALCGCGGGGGGSTAAPPAATASPLDAYAGTWGSACADHAVGTLVVARAAGTTDTITVANRTDYYANADCTGSIVGTVTQSADATATYGGTVDASIVPGPRAAAVSVKVARLTASLPQHTLAVTGSGVTHTTATGQAQWCIAYANGTSTCIRDEGTIPAQTGLAGGLAVQGSTLYDLTANGTSWNVDGVYTKK
jgi:hypothetical protein